MKKLRASDWLKPNVFSYNTSAKLQIARTHYQNLLWRFFMYFINK